MFENSINGNESLNIEFLILKKKHKTSHLFYEKFKNFQRKEFRKFFLIICIKCLSNLLKKVYFPLSF